MKKIYILYFLLILLGLSTYAGTGCMYKSENTDMRIATMDCINLLILPPDLHAQIIKPQDVITQHVVSVNRNEKDQYMITLLPNPSANEIQVTSENKDIRSIELELLNTLGQQVIKSKINMNGSPAVLNTQDLPDGDYQVRIRCRNFLIYKKVIITK